MAWGEIPSRVRVTQNRPPGAAVTLMTGGIRSSYPRAVTMSSASRPDRRRMAEYGPGPDSIFPTASSRVTSMGSIDRLKLSSSAPPTLLSMR